MAETTRDRLSKPWPRITVAHSVKQSQRLTRDWLTRYGWCQTISGSAWCFVSTTPRKWSPPAPPLHHQRPLILLPRRLASFLQRTLQPAFQLIFTTNTRTSGYFNCASMCTSLCSLPQPEFQLLVSPDNPIMQILLGHFTAIMVLIYPIKSCEWIAEDWGTPNRSAAFRLEGIFRNVLRGLQEFLKWPRRITCANWWLNGRVVIIL